MCGNGWVWEVADVAHSRHDEAPPSLWDAKISSVQNAPVHHVSKAFQFCLCCLHDVPVV